MLCLSVRVCLLWLLLVVCACCDLWHVLLVCGVGGVVVVLLVFRCLCVVCGLCCVVVSGVVVGCFVSFGCGVWCLELLCVALS